MEQKKNVNYDSLAEKEQKEFSEKMSTETKKNEEKYNDKTLEKPCQ
jgi:hypothetical protein